MLNHFKKYVTSILAAGLFISTHSFAWNATGHILVAQIAYNNLTPVAQEDVDYLIQQTDFKKKFPNFTPFVYSAPWPDFLNYELKMPTGKTQGIYAFLRAETKSWHFTDDPISIDNYPIKPASVSNSAWAIQYLLPNLSTLINEKQYNMAAYDLIFITHIVGDIHQPLHCASLFSTDFPNGDYGGNLYSIKSDFGANELHAAWDDSLGQFKDWEGSGDASAHPPLSKIKQTAKQLDRLCGNIKANDLNPTDWEQESHQLAIDFVYPIKNQEAPQLNTRLSSNYINDGQAIADKQLCLAGKRLANILNGVFTKPISENKGD